MPGYSVATSAGVSESAAGFCAKPFGMKNITMPPALTLMISCFEPAGATGRNATLNEHVPPAITTVPTVQVLPVTWKFAVLAGAVVMVREVVAELATVIAIVAVVVPITAFPKSTFDGVGNRFWMSFDHAPIVWFMVLVPSVTRNVAVRNAAPPQSDPVGGLWRIVTVHELPAARAPVQVLAVMSQKSVVLPPA